MSTISSRTFSVELERLRDQLARLAASRHSARYLATLSSKLDALSLAERFAFNYSFIAPVAMKYGIDANTEHVDPADIVARLSAIDARPPRTSKDPVDLAYLVCILACLEDARPTPIASHFRAHVVALIRGEIELEPQLWFPLPGQLAAYTSGSDVTGCGGSGGGGKSDLILGRALTQHRVSAIFRHHASETLALRDRLFEILATRDLWNGAENVMRTPDGRSIEFAGVANPGDEQKHQGRAKDFLALDEIGAGFPEAAARFLMGWVRTTDLTQHCSVLMSMNPPSAAESRWLLDYFAPWVARDYAKPAASGEVRHFVVQENKDVEVSADTVIEVEGEKIKPESRAFCFLQLRNNPYLAADGRYFARLNALPEPQRSRIMLGDFYADLSPDASQVIPSAWVEAAMKRWTPTPPCTMESLGADVARGGKDRTVIARRHGNWFDKPIVYAGIETPDGPKTAGVIVAATRDEAVVHIDAIGVGASPYDFLLRSGWHVLGVNVGTVATRRDKSGLLEFSNLRTQLWWSMREALDPANNRGIALPPDDELLRDLTAPRFVVRGAKIYIESRDEIIKRIGRSPDLATAFILALMDTPKRPRQREQPRAEYNPYESMSATRDPYAAIG